MQSLIDRWQHKKDHPKYINDLAKSIDQGKKDHQVAEQIHDEVFEEMDCLACANCCKSIPPIVSNRDVKRISKSLGMDRKSFVDKYIIIDNDGDQVINASPCPFLLEDNKCKIYADRPAACRDYPHSGAGVFYQHLKHHKRNAKYCPGLLEIMKRLADIR